MTCKAYEGINYIKITYNCLKSLENYLKNYLNYFKYNIFCFINFEQVFRIYIRMEISKHSNYDIENIEIKNLNSIEKIQFLEFIEKE